MVHRGTSSTNVARIDPVRIASGSACISKIFLKNYVVLAENSFKDPVSASPNFPLPTPQAATGPRYPAVPMTRPLDCPIQ
jgi:hypothetical protein